MSDVNQAHLEKLETLPEGWADSTVSEIVQMVSANNKKLAQKKYLEEGEFPVIDQGQDFIGGYSNDKDLVIEEEPPFIVFGDHTRAFKFANFQFVPGADGIKIMKPIGVDPKWCFYIFQAIKLPNKGYARHFQYLKEAYVPVPPPEQQKRIVAKIEELFSHIDVGIEALKKAKQLLKQYRQSVLKAAVTGELTKEWREANKGKLEPASQLLERILETRRQLWEEQQLKQFKSKGKIPKDDKWKEKYKEPDFDKELAIMDKPYGWVGVPVELVCKIVDGDRGKEYPKKTDFHPSGYCLFLSTKNVRPNGFLFDETVFITKEKHEKLRKGALDRGDIIFTSRGTIGNIAHYDSKVQYDCVRINSGMFIIRGFQVWLEADYLEQFLRSPFVMGQINKMKSGSAQPQLPIREFVTFEINFPTKLEQKQVAKLVEERISTIERLDKAIDVQLSKAEINKQSVLFSAFAGELIQGSPNDSNAKLLLQNIKTKAEKTKAIKSVEVSKKRITPIQKRELERKNLINLIHDKFGMEKFSIDELLLASEIDDFDMLKSDLFELLKKPVEGRYRLDMQFDEKLEQYMFCLVARSPT